MPVKSGFPFLVEDNAAYSTALETFLKSSSPAIKEIFVIPVGETCLMELDKNPDLISWIIF
jgi:hypothetical protein